MFAATFLWAIISQGSRWVAALPLGPVVTLIQILGITLVAVATWYMLYVTFFDSLRLVWRYVQRLLSHRAR
jgi:hypothetical protein